MKQQLERFCQVRFLLTVLAGLGFGWAMSSVSGPAVGMAIGGGLTIVLLQRPNRCRAEKVRDHLRRP